MGLTNNLIGRAYYPATTAESTSNAQAEFYDWLRTVIDPTRYSAEWQEEQNRLDREYNAMQADKATAVNIAEAQKNRDFQERMSNTAYTRAVADMQRAGLNPALMFGNGNMLSTPSGSTGSGVSASHATTAFGGAGATSTAIIGAITSLIGSAASLAGNLIGSLPPKRPHVGFQ